MLIGEWLHLKHVYFIHVYFSPVAEGVTAINQAIDAQDERLLMAALTYPRASIYGVTSKCIQEYLEELKKLKDSKKEAGQGHLLCVFPLYFLAVVRYDRRYCK